MDHNETEKDAYNILDDPLKYILYRDIWLAISIEEYLNIPMSEADLYDV